MNNLIGTIPLEIANQYEVMNSLGFKSLDFRELSYPESSLFKLGEKDFIDYIKGIKKQLDKYGIAVDHIHGMYGYPSTFYSQKKNWPLTLKKLIRQYKCAKILGCKLIVQHPIYPYGFVDNKKNQKYIRKNNIEFLKYILPHAKKYGITLCLENLTTRTMNFCHPNETLELIKEINDPNLKMCLDVGHYNITSHKESIYDFIIKAKDYIKAVHLHDNFADQDNKFDTHSLPGNGNVDWQGIKQGLKEINFSGSLFFETKSKEKDFSKFVKEEKSIISFAKKLVI